MGFLQVEANDYKAILISGIIYENGTAEFDPDWYQFEWEPDIPLNNEGDIRILYYQNDEVIAETGFDFSQSCIVNGAKHCMDSMIFIRQIPFVEEADKIVFTGFNKTIAERIISPNAPKVSVLMPNGDEEFRAGEPVTVMWEGFDEDGDELFYVVQESRDGGESWITQNLKNKGNEYTYKFYFNELTDSMLIKVIVTDGINTSFDISDSTFSVKKQISPIKQMKAGVPIRSIDCTNIGNYQTTTLIINDHREIAGCVTPDTAKKLEERGWGTIFTERTDMYFLQNDPYCKSGWLVQYDKPENHNNDLLIKTVQNTIFYFISPHFSTLDTTVMENEDGFLVETRGFYETNGRQYQKISESLENIENVTTVLDIPSYCNY